MNHNPFPKHPLVSVILVTLNEVNSIEKCLTSILNQKTTNFELEILVVDGNSNDCTREILDRFAAEHSEVRVMVNEKRRTPFAFNLGLREARGEYVCIFGAHTIYAQNYIAVCLNEILTRGAVACGGRVVTAPFNSGLEARLVAWALGHPFGSSRKSFRTQPEGFADTVNYPVIARRPLIEVGGYDEELTRNQDNDTNQKLRAKGYKLFCTWRTQCIYHPKATIKDLLTYASRNGFWNFISLKKNSDSMRGRHFIPFVFVLGLLCLSLLAITGAFLPAPFGQVGSLPLFSLLGLHLTAGCVAAFQVAWRERSPEALCLPFVFLGFHIAYGFGTLFAFVTGARADSPVT